MVDVQICETVPILAPHSLAFWSNLGNTFCSNTSLMLK